MYYIPIQNNINIDFALLKPTSTITQFVPVVEMFHLEDITGKKIILKSIINLSPVHWQIFNIEDRKWESFSYESIINYWRKHFTFERSVIVEKIKHISK